MIGPTWKSDRGPGERRCADTGVTLKVRTMGCLPVGVGAPVDTWLDSGVGIGSGSGPR